MRTRIALAFEVLTPLQAAHAFSKGVGRKVTYKQEPLNLKNFPIPQGYRNQLYAVAQLFSNPRNTYFPPRMSRECPQMARELWEGWRGLEEYAREVFPVEERANGAPWILQLLGEKVVDLESGTATPNNELNGIDMTL